MIEAAYNSVYLWAQAVVEAESAEVADVIRVIRRQSLNAPEGIVSVDDETQHTWRPVYVGRIRADGQFDLVWKSGKSVRPIPYPSSRSHSEWDSFLEDLHRNWGGWANPGPAGGVRPRRRPRPMRHPTAQNLGTGGRLHPGQSGPVRPDSAVLDSFSHSFRCDRP